jgi:hypothetical protein
MHTDGLDWKKSSFSGNTGCVEVAMTATGRAVRDTKDPRGPVLLFTEEEWRAFIAGVKVSEFD